MKKLIVFVVSLFFLPIITDEFFTNFKIFVDDKPNGNKQECIEINKAVKKPLSIQSHQYDCFKCQGNAVGSFITIRMNDNDKHLIICDIKVEGEFYEKRGIDIKQLKLNK